MAREDVSRRWKLDIMASGEVFVRRPGKKAEEGSLCVFSTDTKSEAESLVIRHCKLDRTPGSNIMRFNDWQSGVYEELARAQDLFRKTYAERRVRDAKAQER